MKRLIAEKKAEIRKRYADRLKALAELSARTVGDAADEAVREDAVELQFALEGNDLDSLRRLEDAESRIDRADFGVCQSCGESIETKRLLILPETSLCYVCAVEAGRSNPDNRIRIAAPPDALSHL